MIWIEPARHRRKSFLSDKPNADSSHPDGLCCRADAPRRDVRLCGPGTRWTHILVVSLSLHNSLNGLSRLGLSQLGVSVRAFLQTTQVQPPHTLTS